MAQVVIDTNVLVSALIKNGKSRKLVLKLLKEHTVIVSNQLLAELADVISRDKFSVTSSQVDRFISILARNAKMVSVHCISKVILEDPDDDMILATALIGKANYIISGDKHLLKIASYNKLKIVSVTEFINKIQQTKMKRS
jgi:putative PIN family toxin of toxin-antitoxin system